MPKKQKPKRKSNYIPNPEIRNKVKPKKETITTDDIWKLITFLADYIRNDFKDERNLTNPFYENWMEMCYLKDSQTDKNSQKFLAWMHKQKKEGNKVYCFDRTKFIEYQIKDSKEILFDKDLKSICIEHNTKDKNGKTPSTLNLTKFKGGIDDMLVYNSLNQAFSLEIQIVEKEVIKIQKEIVNQEINPDKKFKKKIEKLQNYLNSKSLEKDYLSSLQNLKESIFKLIS